MTGAFDHDIPDEPEALRYAIIELTLRMDDTEHVGRYNRLYDRRHNLERRLIAVGGNSEREALPLLRHPSTHVRYSSAYVVKPFNKALFIETLEALVREGGDYAWKAKSSLENFERIDRELASPTAPRPPLSDDHPSNWRANNPPPAAMSWAELTKLIRATFPDELADKLLALVRPAIGLWPSSKQAATPLGSRLGGRPMGPRDWEWPLYDEEPLYFLGQISLPDLRGLPGADLLPAEGILSFFGDHDFIGGISGGTGDAEWAPVFHWSDLSQLRPFDPPLLPLHEKIDEEALRFWPRLDLPDPFSHAIQGLEMPKEQWDAYFDIRGALIEHGIPEKVRPYCRKSKLLGWPSLVQTNDVETSSGKWRLLLQLALSIGPGGDVYFMIRSEDLAASQFERCEAEVQNT